MFARFRRWIVVGSGLLVLAISNDAFGQEVVLSPVFNSAADIAVNSLGYDATGKKFGSLTLNFAPPSGTKLRVVNSIGSTPINGRFLDLPDASYVNASYGGTSYRFIASYHGGTGNDLVLILSELGSVDLDFKAGLNNTVFSVAIQKDGKILLGGTFSVVNGMPVTRIVRLNPDGSVDPTFQASANGVVENIIFLDDGMILVGGKFGRINGIARPGVARLFPDGRLDESFASEFVYEHYGADGYIATLRMLELRNGQILVSGIFDFANGLPLKCLARLNADGSVDPDFVADIYVGDLAVKLGTVYAIYEQKDGRILAGGYFDGVNGSRRNSLVRLTADGQIDPGFSVSISEEYPTYGDLRVSGIIETADGKILINGEFGKIGGVTRQRLARLNQDGSLDPSFAISANGVIASTVLQADGKILIGGDFTKINGVARNRIARLNSDGSLDHAFMAGANDLVYALAVSDAGDLYVGGAFSTVGETAIPAFARLENIPGSSAVERVGPSTVRLNLEGSVPELQWAESQYSLDGGSQWSAVKPGVRVPGGWQFEDPEFPAQGFIRTRGLGMTSNRTTILLEKTALYGREALPIENWRMEKFGMQTNDSVAADLADADKDGLANLIEYGFGLDPAADSSGQIPNWNRVGEGFEVAIERPAGVEGIDYHAEWSTSMKSGEWYPAEKLETGRMMRFRGTMGSEPKKFFRLRVSN